MELLAGRRLGHETAGAQVDALAHHRRVFVAGEHQHRNLGVAGADGADRIDAAVAGHLQVQDHQVGPQAVVQPLEGGFQRRALDDLHAMPVFCSV